MRKLRRLVGLRKKTMGIVAATSSFLMFGASCFEISRSSGGFLARLTCHMLWRDPRP